MTTGREKVRKAERKEERGETDTEENAGLQKRQTRIRREESGLGE